MTTKQPDEKMDAVSRWVTEFEAAKKDVQKFHQRGEKIVKRFKDERTQQQKGDSRWNLYSSNVQTQQAMLYGQVPKVDVARRFSDAEDDEARVASIILERVLNCDIEAANDTYCQALWHALQDRLIPGMGMCRIRYERKESAVPAEEATLAEDGAETSPAVPEYSELEREDVVVDYVPWNQQLWSPARVFQEVRWWAFEADMSRQQLVERFGEDIGNRVPLNAKKSKKNGEDAKATPWGRAEVWEIWDKEGHQVHWYAEGFPELLDTKADPLKLEGFWPFPRPMCANSTTDTLVPTPDFSLAQDLYDEVDDLSTRIKRLQEAINVRGAYDKTNVGLSRLLTEAGGNELIPVENFAAFMEKGGIAGAIAWLPIDMLVAAITELSKQRLEVKQALFEITGMSDIMRGQADSEGATATEQSIKAKFGSIRIRALQNDFARFASDIQRLKAEAMARFFEPQTLIERSNIMRTADAPLAEAAVALIKSAFGLYRVEVKPESVSMADFAGQRSEATEFVTGISTFMTACAPLVEKIPGSGPALLELLGLVMARFHGFGGEAEGIIDKAIKQLQAQQEKAAANPQPPPPDPKLQAAQLKAQTDLQKVQLEHQADMERIAAETQAEASKQQMQAQFNIQEEQARAVIEVKAAHAMPRPQPKGEAT